jgi:Peptidase family S41
MRLAALVSPRNGHTGIFPLDPAHRRRLHLYPLRLYEFSDGVFVVEGDFAGRRIVAIDGMQYERVAQLVRPLVPYDNDSSLRAKVPSFSLVAEVLDGLGIGSGVRARTFTFDDGLEAELRPITSATYLAAFGDARGPTMLPRRPAPLYLAQSRRDLWMRKTDGVLHVGYNSTFSPTQAFARRLGQAAREADRVVVDVRLNGGGDNRTYGPLLEVLADVQRLAVLIGRGTFSAAGNFATEVGLATNATFIGEPTGGGVNQYGDSVGRRLPATGWNLQVATLYHEKGGPHDRRLAVDPDVHVEPNAADFFADRDPVLDAATTAT